MGIRDIAINGAGTAKNILGSQNFDASLASVPPKTENAESAETPVEGENYGEPAAPDNAVNSYNFSSSVFNAIKSAAKKYGLDTQLMMDIAQIESSGRPHAVSPNGSCLGLFQLNRRTHSGNLLNTATNANIAARELKEKITRFNKEHGRNPAATEIYLMHQQGDAGARAHLQNPQNIAWENISRFYKCGKIAKKAITKNIPDDLKHLLPKNVELITSAQFMAIWAVKCEGLSFETALARYQNIAQIQETVTVKAPDELISSNDIQLSSKINMRSLE
jgi:hypothetical protein